MAKPRRSAKAAAQSPAPDKPSGKGKQQASAAEASAWEDRPLTFHFLTAGPPLLILYLCLDLRSALQWFPLWVVSRHAPRTLGLRKDRLAAIAAQGVTIYAAHAELSNVPPDRRVLAAVGLGMVMSTAYKNVFAAICCALGAEKLIADADAR